MLVAQSITQQEGGIDDPRDFQALWGYGSLDVLLMMIALMGLLARKKWGFWLFVAAALGWGLVPPISYSAVWHVPGTTEPVNWVNFYVGFLILVSPLLAIFGWLCRRAGIFQKI